MARHDRFELRRQSDELVYSFVRTTDPRGGMAYQRRDLNVWIRRDPRLGWIAWDDETQTCTGRPWDVLPQDQGEHPPEGVWVSRKGPKSYVYELVYVAG